MTSHNDTFDEDGHDKDSHDHDGDGLSRRKVLECMTWAGTGVLWTVAGGVPRSLGLVGEAHGRKAPAALTFLQISDSHIGFDKPANPNAHRHARGGHRPRSRRCRRSPPS